MAPCGAQDLLSVGFAAVIPSILAGMTQFLLEPHNGVVRNHYNLVK
jgi:hypothetical protein